jgi:hypothetical protein
MMSARIQTRGRSTKLQTKRQSQPTRISTVTLTVGGSAWTVTATDRLEALEAIAQAAEAERAGK